MICGELFCCEMAVARLTAPMLEAGHPFCERHLAEQLKWADRYRKIPGAVRVEQLTRDGQARRLHGERRD
jgi:hypothetical protein